MTGFVSQLSRVKAKREKMPKEEIRTNIIKQLCLNGYKKRHISTMKSNTGAVKDSHLLFAGDLMQ